MKKILMTLVASVIIMAALVGCGTSNSQKNYASGGKSIQVNMYKENVKLAKVGFLIFIVTKRLVLYQERCQFYPIHIIQKR